MRDPKRILQKILGTETDLAPFEQSGEPLDLLVETLREVQRVRKVRQWLLDHARLDAALTPAMFHRLLDLPEINFSEETDRNLDVVQHSLKHTRKEDDPVAVAHLNTCLRELYRDLSALHDLKVKEHSTLHLAPYMTGDLVERVMGDIERLRLLDWRGVGYALTGWKARALEKDFEALFPEARRVHPLRKNLNAVQLEMAFYHRCLETNIKWAITGLDLFRVLSEDLLSLTLENLAELGNGLWNLVYNGAQLNTTLRLSGIDFSDITTLFDPDQVPLTVI
ncbi:MAG: hypothetical protein GWM98_14880 [Nitrospinaceae bacterium]|nr:hypothetical protein [Nitrospinaceae bacterium]NIR55525.1 hypothetical protein [Nitrospinaceae bacterium]NIS85959.1 hypothetical protein [Nitrospinaceae bacterium]NIT82805.1 hypothetical protein [Nitrospinaceae bacterium]NIU45007.1 hypothetical protein [Nitrospinaceae bacterium]